MMSPAAIVFWILAIGTFFISDAAVLYLFLCTSIFGALNTLPSTVNVLPQTVAALLLGVRILRRRENFRVVAAALVTWRGFALLAGFVIWGVFSGLVLPYIFEGRVDVVGMDNPVRLKLEPTLSNINQSVYLVVDLVSTLALFAYLKTDKQGEAREHLMRALVASGVLFIASGLVDYSNLVPDFVALFKNASYTMFTDAQVGDMRRISGFFSESAAYGPRCVSLGALLFFARSACRAELWRKWICPGVSLALIIMGVLSTSSTAFICVFVFIAAMGVRVGMRIYRSSPITEYSLELVLMGLGSLMLIAAWIAEPALLDVPIKLLDMMIFKKAESSSFFERSLWNHTGKMAFYQTWGLGAGAGSTRTSNWAISILSNTGVLGGLLMGGFLGLLFWQGGSQRSERWATVARGGKYSLVVILAGLLASGTNIDPGLNFVTVVAIVAAGSGWADQIGAASRPRSRARSSKSSKSSRSRRSRRRTESGEEAAQPA